MKYLLIILPLSVFAMPNINLYDAKNAMLDYVNSGDYQLEQWQAVKPALNYLIHHKPAAKAAIVFDIDETLLSNFQEMKKYNFGGNSEIFHENEMLADAELIPASYALYQQALAQGYKVFIITGRGVMVRAATIKNLERQGIKKYQSIEFWHGKTPKTVMQYKSAARCAIAKMGYNIVINVGDQASDLIGSCAGAIRVKLPNPFYSIPANQLKRSQAY